MTERVVVAGAIGKGAGSAKANPRKARDEEPQGGFAQSRGRAAPRPASRSPRTPCWGGEAKEIAGLDFTEVDVLAADVLPCLAWSVDGKAFFLAEKTGVVCRVRAEGLVEEARLDTKAACSWLSLSAEGLLATIEATGEVWKLGGRVGEDARQFLVYAEGRQVLVLTERRPLAVRVPEGDE